MVSHGKKQEADVMPQKTITNTDYAEEQLLRTTTPKVQSLLHSLDQAARRIGLYVTVCKAESMRLKNGTIFILSGKPLKLIKQFTFLGSKHLIYRK